MSTSDSDNSTSSPPSTESSDDDGTEDDSAPEAETGPESRSHAPPKPDPIPEPKPQPPTPAKPEPKPEAAPPPAKPEPKPEAAPPPAKPEPKPEAAPPPAKPEPKPEAAPPPAKLEPKPEAAPPPAKPDPVPEAAAPPEAEPEPPVEAIAAVVEPPAVSERPQVEPGPTPVFWPTLLNELSQPNVDFEFIVRTLGNAVDYARIVLQFMDIVGGVLLGSEQQDVLFGLFVDVIAQRARLDIILDDASASTLINFIVNYKRPVSSWAHVEKITIALSKLYAVLSPEKLAAIDTVFAPIVGKYVPLAYAVLGQTQPLVLGPVLDSVSAANAASIHALIWFCDHYTYEDLSQENRALLADFRYGTIAGALLNGDKTSQLLGTRFLASLFHFRPADLDPEATLPLDTLIGLLASGSHLVRITIVRLLLRVSVDSSAMTADTRLSSVLTHLCEHLRKPDGLYAQNVFEFVGRRKEIRSFNDCVGSLFLADNTLRGAVILATELGLFRETPEFGTAAFALPAKQKRLLYALDAAVYIASKTPYTRELAEGLLGQLLVIYSSAAILKVPEQKSAAVVSVRPFLKGASHCLDVVSQILLKEITRITDSDILREFARGAAELQVPDLARPPEDDFCQVFCHVWPILWSDVDVFNLTGLFWSIPDRTPPTTTVGLVATGVPDPFLGKLATVCEAEMVKAPQLAIISAAMPGLQPDAIHTLVKFVFSSELITKRTVVEFLMTLSINYFAQVLPEIEQANLGAQMTTNIFVSRAKRQVTITAVSGVFEALPAILSLQTLEVKDQEAAWRVIAATFPVVNYEAVHDSILSLHEVFPLLKDVSPTAEQYTPLLRPEFSRDFHVFLATVPPDDALARQVADLWFRLTGANLHLAKDTKAVTDLLFRLSRQEEILFDLVFRVKRKRLPLSEAAVPWALFLRALAQSAHEKDIHPDPVTYIEFILYILQFTVCTVADLRTASIVTIASLLNLVDAPAESPSGIAPDEINSGGYSLDLEIAKNAPDRFVTVLLKKLVEGDEILPCHSLLIQALFAERPNLITEERLPYILRLFAKHTSLPQLPQHHIEIGALALAERAMDSFIPVLFGDKSAFKALLFQRILRHFDIRPIFIERYHRHIANVPHAAGSLGSFAYLKDIVLTEPERLIGSGPLGYFVSIIIMSLGLLANLRITLPFADRRSHQAQISEVFDEVIIRTPLAFRPELTVNMTTALEAKRTLGVLADLVAQLSAEVQLSIITRVTETLSTGYALAGGVFFVRLSGAIDPYALATVKSTLLDSLKQVLARGDPSAHLFISAAASQVLPASAAKLVIADLYAVVVDGLRIQRCHENDRLAATLTLCSIIEDVPRDAIVPLALGDALRLSFELLPFDREFLKPLAVWAASREQLPDFVQQSTLSTEGLLTLLGVAEEKVLAILAQLEGDDIVAGLAARGLNARVIAGFGLTALRSATQPYSIEVLRLLASFARQVHGQNDKSAYQFKAAVIDVALALAEKRDGSEEATLGVETLKALVR